MEFLLSLSYLKLEIAFFLANIAFLAIFFVIELVNRLKKLSEVLFPKGRVADIVAAEPIKSSELRTEEVSETQEVISLEDSSESAQEEAPSEEEVVESTPEISLEKRLEIIEAVKLIRTKIARGEFTDARAKIIEGLAVDKWNKDLNCLLASLYERDKDYKKAEFIYKDLILVHDTDPEIYMKLGFALSIQGKFEIAFEIYKRLANLSEAHIEAIEMLANLAHELGRFEESAEYAKQFLKAHPRNADILSVLAVSLIALERKEEALETIEKLKNLDPYNPRIREMKDKLELELELAKKFESPEVSDSSN